MKEVIKKTLVENDGIFSVTCLSLSLPLALPCIKIELAVPSRHVVVVHGEVISKLCHILCEVCPVRLVEHPPQDEVLVNVPEGHPEGVDGG